VVLKIASKVIANRLKKILPEIVSEEQSAFVPGRLITDNVITAYECLHFMKSEKSKKNVHCALKLDMQKAYDRLEWNFLEAIMKKLGFSHKFVETVMKGVGSVSFSVLFNGAKTESFRPSRGIRQGDPISPYLFLLAAEGLSCLLRDAMRSGEMSGVQVAPSAPRVNHLLFADDCILFGKAAVLDVTKMKEVLEKYCNASGQRINKDKSSSFFGKGCPQLLRNNIKAVMDVQNDTLNDKYLGLPSDVGRSKNGAFSYLKDRIWKRLQGWMERLLSGGGKEILIKSVVQAIPTYSMALFKLPRGLCEHITSMVRKFWWGSKKGERKAAWVSWDTMIMPKYKGGLGFRDIEIFNLALLARQVWRILQDPETLSARILKAVYFPQSDILSAAVGSRPSQVWRSLCEGRDMIKLGLIRRIGNGATTNIWNDNWLPRQHCMRPYGCTADQPPMLVSELICPTTKTWIVAKLEKFLLPMDRELVQQIPVTTVAQQDFWAWFHEKTGVFSVRSAYRMIMETKHRREGFLEGRTEASNVGDEEKNWKKLWKVKVPSKLRIFAWRLARSSLPTGELREKRHMATSACCPICNVTTDTWRHSLLECNMAKAVWALKDDDITLPLFGDETPDPRLWLFSLSNTLSQEKFIEVLLTL
jgi:hypothetical protein